MLTNIQSTTNLYKNNYPKQINFRGNSKTDSYEDMLKDIEESFVQKKAKKEQAVLKRNAFLKNYKIAIITSVAAICSALGFFIRPLIVAGENEQIKTLNNKINSKNNELSTLNNKLATNYTLLDSQQHKLNTLGIIYLNKTKQLNERDSILNAKEKALNERDSAFTAQKEELNTISQNTVEGTNIHPNNIGKKVSKVLNTAYNDSITVDETINILKQQFTKLKVEKSKKRNDVIHYKAEDDWGWSSLENYSGTKLKPNETKRIIPYFELGRTIDGLYWGESIDSHGKRRNHYIYTSSGQRINEQERLGLYKTNILATMQNISNLRSVDNVIFSSILATKMSIYEIESDSKKNCMYCKSNDGTGLRISYNVDSANVSGDVEVFKSYDEAKYSGSPVRTEKFTYKETDDKSAVIFKLGSEADEIYKINGNEIYRNGQIIIQ